MEKKNIVVADDFENTRWAIEFSLKNIPCNIMRAGDGVEALKYFDGQKIDLLITDYNMPNMNGASLIKAVRNIQSYKFIPTLVLTTETNEEKKKQTEELRITGWIKKPFVNEDFLKIVKKCLNTRELA